MKTIPNFDQLASNEVLGVTRRMWNVGSRLKSGLRPPVAVPEGAPLAVRARLGTGLCPVDFADKFRVDATEVYALENGTVEPASTTVAFLELIEMYPEQMAGLLDALSIARRIRSAPTTELRPAE